MSLDLRHVVTNRIELHNVEVPLRGLDSGTLHVAASLGFTGGTVQSCENLELQPRMSGLVYVPPPGIVVPDVLPKSWLGLLTCSCALLSAFSDVLQ